MTRRAATLVATIGMAALVAACGGAGSATSQPGTDQAPGAASFGAATTDAPLDAPASAAGVEPTAGAASGSSDAGTAGQVDVCALLGDDEIMTITGLAVTKRVAGPTFGIYPAGCTWTLASTPATVDLVVGVLTPGGRAYYDTYFAPFAEENGDRVIDGVGDDALYGIADSMTLATGDIQVGLQYVVYPDADDAVVEALARQVVAALGG